MEKRRKNAQHPAGFEPTTFLLRGMRTTAVLQLLPIVRLEDPLLINVIIPICVFTKNVHASEFVDEPWLDGSLKRGANASIRSQSRFVLDLGQIKKKGKSSFAFKNGEIFASHCRPRRPHGPRQPGQLGRSPR